MATRSLQLPTGDYLTFRIPDDGVMVNIIRLMLVASRNPKASEALLIILGELVASPIDMVIVQQARETASASGRAEIAAMSDAALWLCVLFKRHDASLLTLQIQLTLLGPVQPHRPEKPKPKSKRPYGKARAA